MLSDLVTLGKYLNRGKGLKALKKVVSLLREAFSSDEGQDWRNSKEWREARCATLERDAHRCQDCGKNEFQTSSLDVHHIQLASEYESKRFDQDNLVTVCRNCHINRHKSKNGITHERAVNLLEAGR